MAINLALRKVIRDLLQMPAGSVRPSNDNSPADGSAFASVLIVSNLPTGWDGVALTPSPNPLEPDIVIEALTGTRQVLADVTFYRANAFENARRLPALFQTSKGIALMRGANLGYTRASNVRDVSAPYNGIMEPRALVSIEFTAESSETAKLETFGEFDLAVDYQP